MKVLLVGRRAESEALAAKLAMSKERPQLLAWPDALTTGNAARWLSPDATVIEVSHAAKRDQIDLVILASEDAVSSGIANVLETLRIPCWGPNRVASHFRWDGHFLCEFGKETGVSLAVHSVHLGRAEARVDALRLLAEQGRVVISAQGASGRVSRFSCGADVEVERIFAKVGGGFLRENVLFYGIERDIPGVACTVVACVGGSYCVPLGFAIRGPNATGFTAKIPWMTLQTEKRIMGEVIERMAGALARSGTPYSGFLVAGVTLTDTAVVVNEVACAVPAQVTQELAQADGRDWLTLIQHVMGLRPFDVAALAPQSSRDELKVATVRAAGH